MLRCTTVLLVLGVAACGGDGYELPERTTQVAVEEARVASLIERHESAGFGGRKGECAVRVLGKERGSTFAWATCTYPPTNGVEPESGVSTAYRVDGTEVRSTEDGSGYDDSVRGLFPEALAEAVLEEPERLRPTPRP